MSTHLDLTATDLPSLVKEVDDGLGALITALGVAEKFGMFLPANVKAELESAVKVFTQLKSLLDRFV